MKTPQKIIDALPDGNRKRACVMLEVVCGLMADPETVWGMISDGKYPDASKEILKQGGEQDALAQVLADMIWEG